jgi:hypothetical protein
MGGACSTNGEKINAYRIVVAKPEGKRPLARPRRRWVDNIKMDLREIHYQELPKASLFQSVTFKVFRIKCIKIEGYITIICVFLT